MKLISVRSQMVQSFSKCRLPSLWMRLTVLILVLDAFFKTWNYIFVSNQDCPLQYLLFLLSRWMITKCKVPLLNRTGNQPLSARCFCAVVMGKTNRESDNCWYFISFCRLSRSPKNSRILNSGLQWKLLKSRTLTQRIRTRRDQVRGRTSCPGVSDISSRNSFILIFIVTCMYQWCLMTVNLLQED